MNAASYLSLLARVWNVLAPILPGADPRARVPLEAIVRRVQRKFPDGAWFSGQTAVAAKRLIDSLHDTGNLHPFGAFYVSKLVEGLLENRARLDALWARHPEILAQAVERPIIILGLPRSGTSFLFNLLASDPAHRYLRNWETTVSQIPPASPTGFERDPRRRTGRLLMHFQNYLAPDLKHIHEFHLDGPEECTPLLMQGFATQALAGMFDVPEYSRWLDGADHADTYAHHRRILQTLQWAYPGERWLLKSPDHLAALDALLATYPDACLVHLHRDPVQSVSSWASLNAVFRGICSAELDASAIGDQVLDRLATDMDAYLRTRERHPPSRFLDLPYRDLIADPLATAERIYAHFALEYTEAARTSFATFLAADHEKTRSHRYKPEDFGLTPARIRERFGGYIARFAVAATTREA